MGYEYLLFVLASFFLCQLAFSSSVTHLCSKDESISLLKFKNTLTVCEFGTEFPFCYCQQSSPKTRSWNMSRDCCSWDGVVCDDFIGHVIELDLGCSQLQGKIDSNSSLFQLSHLRMLTLSLNSFSNSHISPEFGKFSSLTHLDLSWSNFSGQIPSEFSHLSKLQSLYLGGNDMLFGPHNFKLLLQNLTQLRELDLTNVNISSTIPPNFSSHLTTLWLGSTGLYGIIPESIFHLPNLETLALWGNHQLSGDFPKTKWNSSASLKVLDLNRVNFSGCIPKGPQFATFENNSYEGNAGLRGFPVSEDCGSSWIPDSNNTTFVPDEESDSSFLSELSWKVVLTGYGCGLFIGCIIAYFMLSSQNPNWLSGIAGDLEYRIITRRRKKQRSQRHYRRRNNGF